MWKFLTYDPTKKHSQPMGYDAFLKTSWTIILQDNILCK